MADNSGASQFDGTSAFASAVARARQIAAKITPGSGDAPVPGIKRTMDDVASFGEPDSKKLAGDSSIGAQLRAIADSQPGFGAPTNTEAARAAQEAAARINRQLGISPENSMQSQKPGVPMGAGGMMVQTEEHRVPDKMVGLIIGKGGEQITRLQAETGCKVQIAPDSAGSDMRPCQLTGAPQAIMECKRQMSLIIERGQGSQPMGGGGGSMDGGMGEGNTVVEMNIPGSKVGLIIGKGGETIRQLQESANVKMVMIQDSNSPTAQDKPLRISGDPQRCQRAKEMVLELLAEKDGVPPRGGNMFNDYGSQQFGNNFNDHGGMGGSGPGMDISVPRQGVGLVIGKKGEMIQKIQNETGAKVQFKTDDDDGQSQDRICSVTGPQDKVQQAIQKIQDLLAKANIMGHPIQKGPGGFGGPMGPGHMNDMNRGPGGPFSPPGGRGPGGMGGHFDNNMQDTTTYTVPADKCGLVIGKGGENIREIIRQTGAHVELDRNPPPNMTDKLFKIRGNPGQIQAAISMIQEKTGQQGGPDFNPGHGPVGGGMMGGPGGPNGGPPGGPGGPGPQGPGGFDQFGGQFGQNQPQQQQYGGAPQGAPQGWNAYGNQYPQQQNMANKPSNDANAAAWAYYYAYGGGQPGQQPAGAPQQPAAPQQQQPAQPQQYQQIAAAQPSELRVNHTINPTTGQPDYSQAWVEYYRSQGMLHEAQMVLQQVAQNQTTAGGQGGQPGQP